VLITLSRDLHIFPIVGFSASIQTKCFYKWINSNYILKDFILKIFLLCVSIPGAKESRTLRRIIQKKKKKKKKNNNIYIYIYVLKSIMMLLKFIGLILLQNKVLRGLAMINQNSFTTRTLFNFS